MRLDSLRVQNYRCIEDSGWVSIDGLVCLIGRNESGKTAFMEAVQTLNPAYEGDGYAPYDDYPRGEWTEYANRHEDDPDVVASARLELDAADVEAVEEAHGDVLAGRSVTVSRDYENRTQWDLDLEEGACLAHLREEHDLPEALESRLSGVDALSELSDYDSDGNSGPYADLAAHLGGDPETVVANGVGATLRDRLPEFRYIGESSIMSGTIRVADLAGRREAGQLTPGDRAFLSLLDVAGLDLADLQDVEDWRRRLTELETASATVSEEAISYWGQSGDIRIRIQSAGEGDERLLDVRVENRARDVTVGFEQRSQGFRRFFSTFCQLSALRTQAENVVVLLDEPGLNLHARAKQDFLNFLKTELASDYPLIYTTHWGVHDRRGEARPDEDGASRANR
jgi:hypothetical protein